ncbi:rRNA processing/ribosome biogenesis-domain-containing protein [Mycena sp. CBHHK59/15]|nr:rRNA processing/ribosome biogenesis-domain-containing protein [Mycena sp. CBHHK59/15]
MDGGHPLKALLQLQLASDSYAVLHLPYILSSLSPECLLPSQHSSKWTARINSLLHSKSADARWAGLCIAYKTALLSKSVMIECAQSWLGVALPNLSKKESVPILSASVRLLRVIFSVATDVPEFQRQVATPNVSKLTVALMPLAEKHIDVELKTLILTTLTALIPLYPTLHKASHTALSALSLSFLSGNPYKPPNASLTSAASRLYAVLHFTGGKVGAANLWRKSIDETLAFGWKSFLSLRSTFPVDGWLPTGLATEEPLLSIPLNLDRLRCCVLVLCDLLRTTTQRPVQVPLGPLSKFSATLLSCTINDRADGHIDPGVRAMEVAVTPQIWLLACDLTICLANCVRHHLSSSTTRIVTCITFHLEHPLASPERLQFSNTRTPNRLARAILPLLSVVLAKQVDAREKENEVSGRSKKSKKRAREYEGDEVFKTSREVICSTADEGNVLLASFAVIQLILRNPNLSPAVHSISCRIILSVLLALPQMSPASFSSDLRLHSLLLERVQNLSMELGAGSSGGMSQSLGLVLGASLGNTSAFRGAEILLHPRLAPLLRSLPYVESLSLFRGEESQEESDACQILGLVAPQLGSSVGTDIDMAEPPPVSPPANSKPPVSPTYIEKPATTTQAPATQPLPPASLTLTQSIVVKEVPTPLQSTTTIVNDTSLQLQTHVSFEEDEKNEEMPAIDLGSDSDSE